MLCKIEKKSFYVKINKDFYTNYAIYIHIISTFFTSYPSTNYDCVGGITIRLPTTTKKSGSQDVMSNAIKDLSVFSSSPIDFKVEWYSSRSDKWYRSQGHGFESWECHCNEGIVRGTTIQLPTIILKTGPWSVMSNAIKEVCLSHHQLVLR